MNRDTLNRYLAAVLTTLRESDDEAPSGILYAALMAHGCSHGDFMTVQAMLVSSGLATLDGDMLALTDAGRAIADKINAAIAA